MYNTPHLSISQPSIHLYGKSVGFKQPNLLSKQRAVPSSLVGPRPVRLSQFKTFAMDMNSEDFLQINSTPGQSGNKSGYSQSYNLFRNQNLAKDV